MNLVELTKLIVSKLVKNAEAVSVEELKEEDIIIINVLVSEEDMGRAIGRDGKIINSIRTIIQASAYVNGNNNVKLNINSNN